MKIFNEHHEMFRATVRSFVEKEIAPHIEEWEYAGWMPRWIWTRKGSSAFSGSSADGEDVVREISISMVKLFTAEMVNRIAYDCVQISDERKWD